MEKVKVSIEMDSTLVFWPTGENDWSRQNGYVSQPLSMEISKELFDEFERAKVEWGILMEKFEQLYRIQRGQPPNRYNEIPDYTLLPK